jgi:hypothetical protein
MNSGQPSNRRTGGPRSTVIAGLAAAALLAGCASQASRSGAAGSEPTAGPAASPPTSSAACASGTVELSYRVGDPPTTDVCVHVGARVGITWFGAPGYAWTPIASSNADVVSAAARTTDGGPAAGSATGTARAPGTAELSSTGSFTESKSGPPTVRWTVVIHVIP